MRGKVKYVTRNISYIGNMVYQHRSDVHDVRYTTTNAILYNGEEVVLDEDDIKSYYNRTRITDKLVNTISDSLHNVWVDYVTDKDGVNFLDGSIENYIS